MKNETINRSITDMNISFVPRSVNTYIGRKVINLNLFHKQIGIHVIKLVCLLSSSFELESEDQQKANLLSKFYC